jgi:RND family efflux transporter MFP subunit
MMSFPSSLAPRRRLAPLAAALVALAAASLLTARAAEPAVIAWSAPQALAAGVITQAVELAPESGAGLVLQGTVELPPQATEVLSAPLAGVVQQVLVAPGQAVRAGETVARLTSPELITWQRELLQAESQARLAATRLERDEKLYAEGIIAGLRLQDSRTQHELAQAAVKEKRLALQMAGAAPSAGLQPGLAVRAQAAGTVLEVTAAPGQRLEAGMPVARIARGGRWTLALQATPEQAARLRVGDTLSVAGCKATARLSAVVPQVTAGNQSVQLRADLATAEPCVRLNQFVQAAVQQRAGGASAAPATAGAVRVLASAVVRQAGQTHVFVRTAAGFMPTPVTLGGEAGDAVSVTAGLKPGDVVAVRGTAALKGAWQGLGGGK